MDRTHLLALLKQAFDRPIAFHRCFVDLTGNVNAALMLSQAFYWANRTSDPNGWFWKTQHQWQDETGIPIPDQNEARELLRACPFWKEDFRGSPPKLYFRVDLEELAKALECRVRPISLEECLTIHKTQLTGLSKGGFMRAKKAGKAQAVYVNFADLLKDKGMVCGLCQADIEYGLGQKPECLAFDYVQPFANGGGHSAENLMPVHARCKELRDVSQLSEDQRVELSDGQKDELSEDQRDELSDGKEINSLNNRELIPLKNRKFSITETTSEITAENTGPNPLLAILLKAYEHIAKSQKELIQVSQQAELLFGDRILEAELREWLEVCNSYPAPAFIAQTFRRWKNAETRRREKQLAESLVGASEGYKHQRLAGLDSGSQSEPRWSQEEMPCPVTLSGEPDTTVWAAVCRQIKQELNHISFTTWFKPTRGVGLNGTVLIVQVPDPVFEDYILNNYRDLLEQALPETVTGIQFVTPAELNQAA